MFKTLIEKYIKTMNNKRKIKETLAKKLSEKKIPKKLEAKIGQAENKSQFFKEIKNKEKSNKNAKKKEIEALLGVEKGNISITTKPMVSENKNNDVATRETTGKHSLRKIKSADDMKSSMRIVKTKSREASKTSDTNEIPTKEEEGPSTNKKVKNEMVEKKWQPTFWETMLENIRLMRSNKEAPVDTMGCHKCADENADEKTQRFHKLIALMLSSQTKDETTYHAMLRLREHNLTPKVICNLKLNVLENILHPVSFYKNKAKYMQQTSKILIEKYNSDIPNNIKELVALPGVGPKMAHICMATAWHEVTGIGVDVHVHRITNRIGWLPKPTKEPEQTRLALEAWLPQHLWSEVNHLLVGFGQTICTPVKPKCIDCLNLQICPAAKTIIKKKIVN